ncbi:YopT-type cysteine protease domain-containing protein [Legionella quateirensis]|uniref:Yersinia/Haemophilus virulence surface antigen n=1 Tax=Legionella quateirensis TaxID=45072 RepID=A0A378KTP7_9GAMM|nr:YopT-type cysteine protease domain-containing protein [Legionella quateirensis]KTD44625.1 hypothetical protein Lqua_2792 [Legionella quateirensis]STY16857.1 Yersinia/Haemophilus virulence surface antigen [Legionella quateirensis]
MMSIYSCADEIKLMLKNGVHEPHTGVMKYLLPFIPRLPWITDEPVRPLEDHERRFLEDVQARLKLIGKDGYNESKKTDLGDLIEDIRAYKENHHDIGLNALLLHIINDLTIVKDGRKPLDHSDEPNPDPESHSTKLSPSPEVNEQYQALLNSRLLVSKLAQGTMKELGTSRGECNGFTMSMADSDLSPYKNNGIKQVEFNKTIHKYQKNQLDREKDQQYIKKTRLTTKTFCPSLTEQAEKLYQIASEHVGEDLSVILQCKVGSHATYLSIQEDQKIRYADPNHGVFLFDNKEQFISAYKLMYQYHNQKRPDFAFTFFSVNQLKEDKNNELAESNTLAGKWRSLMTGTKYKSDSVISNPDLIIPTSLGALAGGAAGAVAGAAIGSVVPIIGTVIGAIIGGIAGASLGGAAGARVVKQAQSKGHFGLLGPYHYLREKLHDFSESVKDKLGFQRECDEIPALIIPESDSHSKMLLSLCGQGMTHPSRTQQNMNTEEASTSSQNSNGLMMAEQKADIPIPDVPDTTVDEDTHRDEYTHRDEDNDQHYVSYSPR